MFSSFFTLFFEISNGDGVRKTQCMGCHRKKIFYKKATILETTFEVSDHVFELLLEFFRKVNKYWDTYKNFVDLDYSYTLVSLRVDTVKDLNGLIECIQTEDIPLFIFSHLSELVNLIRITH